MAKLVYALNQSLDGCIDHDAFAPGPGLFRHFIDDMRSLSGVLHGRKMYEVMRYWDDDQEGWGDPERAFAEAWRGQPKWVVSSTLRDVGPNAELLKGDLATAVRGLTESVDGVIEVAGPELAGGLGELGLIDEYRLYIHPVVVGGDGGKRFFTGPLPRLRLVDSERFEGDVIRLTYAPG